MLSTLTKIMEEDIQNILEDNSIEWKKFNEKTILITGATGLIGRQLVLTFLSSNQKHGINTQILAVVRNKSRAEAIFKEVLDCPAFRLIVQDIRSSVSCPEKVDYIVHGASITSSKSFVDFPVETIQTGIQGCINILEFARTQKLLSGVFISSMEIYGQSDQDTICENEYGFLDHLNTRSSYSESKKMCECLCSCYLKEFSVPFIIARLTQTFGPGVEKEDQRVFAQFAKAVLEEKNIVLFSTGETVRNYVYLSDAIRAIITLLLKGIPGEAYNVANEDTEISIFDMAKMLVNTYSNGKYEVEIRMEDAQRHGFNPTARTCIDSRKLMQLGWKPEVGLKEAFDRMIKSMEEQNGTGFNL